MLEPVVCEKNHNRIEDDLVVVAIELINYHHKFIVYFKNLRLIKALNRNWSSLYDMGRVKMILQFL